MPCTDRQAYNARRRAKYRDDKKFREAENQRSTAYMKKTRTDKQLDAFANALFAYALGANTGLSRHQIAYLKREGILPPLKAGRAGKSKRRRKVVHQFEGGNDPVQSEKKRKLGPYSTVNISQVFWFMSCLAVCAKPDSFFSQKLGEAFDLPKLKAALARLWDKPFPFEVGQLVLEISWRALLARELAIIEETKRKRFERAILAAPLPE